MTDRYWEVHSPVCGTDGNTYKNECELRLSACRKKHIVTVAYKGDCDLCKGVECQWGAHCKAGECICPTNCVGSTGIHMSEPVCASNLVTYPNECELQQASCSQPAGTPPLVVIFYGDCREKNVLPPTNPTLPFSRQVTSITARPQVTLPNNKHSVMLSGNEAEREACRDIHCDFDATCELGPDNFPRCSCHFDCVSAMGENGGKSVCASDMRIYPSICVMKMEGCQRQEELRLRPLDLCEGMEVKPCNGESPLVDPDTKREYDCGSGPNRQDCPSGSYCHQTPHFARCCKKETNSDHKSCEDSWYGCCPDGKTTALGVDNAGCPSMCGCNKLGSHSDTCEPDTQQCSCKPGVGGVKCDRCEPGYWGLPKISEGYEGCIPCGCSLFGSVRDDCEQMTGRCVCKPGIQGQKCTVCLGHNMILGPNGCVPADITTPAPGSCADLTCYFEATCEERRPGFAECVCRSTCADEDSINSQVVCGNDGHTYGSECQLKLFACRYQKDIVVQALGPCKEETFPGTDWPIHRSTTHRFTEPEDISSLIYKSTRHLLIPEAPNHRYYYNSRNQEESNSLTSQSLHHIGSDHLHSDNEVYFAVGLHPTPATVQIVIPLLGDLCTKDLDCRVKNSHCVRGACICKDGYTETSNRQQCLGNDLQIQPTMEFRACVSQPCQQGGTCVDISRNSFSCLCEPQWTGTYCENLVLHRAYNIPAFNGHSYVQLKPLKAYSKLSIEVEFKTYANDGIILYNQQKNDGTGDFVSLGLVNGFVEFRYNLGNGPVVIASLEQVEMKRFHRVVAKRYQRDGILEFDDYEHVAGQSQGNLKALDLEDDAYVGYVPTNISKVFENIGTDMGLMGCIRKLKIGRRHVELHEGLDVMVEHVIGVRECGENPCSSLPCLHGATCHVIDAYKYQCSCRPEFTGNVCEEQVDPCLSHSCTDGSTCDGLPQGGYVCKCPPGRKGQLCQELDAELYEVFVPEFNGDSYLELPRLEGMGQAFSLEIWFMSREPDGILLYNGQLTNGKGDFICVHIINSHVQFRFDLGSGAASITSPESIELGHWHAVKVSRLNQEGVLQLDTHSPVRGNSGPPLNELNLELPLYIGGVQSILEVNRDAGVTRGLTGAIQRLIVNGETWLNFAKTVSSQHQRGISQYNGPPCPINPSVNLCLNGGICQPVLALYICKCPLNYNGKHCENRIEALVEEHPVKFIGEIFYKYPNNFDTSAINITLDLNNTNSELKEEEEELLEGEMEEYDTNEDDMHDQDI